MRPVRFVPPLMDQIRHWLRLRREAAEPKPIVVRYPNGQYVEKVDPVTRQCTGERQQFLKAPDGKLKILARSEWIADPDVIDVKQII